MPDKEEEKKDAGTAQKAVKQAEPVVVMQHEVFRHEHRTAIGEEWFDVAADGTASFPLRLLEAAETAGFRRVT